MKKDVIYIDTEDDITSIIEKVKGAAAPIVALVPPKRVGVLQSTVNLKLLQRAADNANKRVVLITNDAALSALAGGLAIPIAKNLQSKPEIAELSALDSDDGDVINGEDLPAEKTEATDASEPIKTADDLDVEELTVPASLGATALHDQPENGPKRAVGVKIPNFNVFRKKLFLIGGLGLVVIAFFVWAIFFAAQATIAITARTNGLEISKTLQLKPDAKLDAAQAVVPVITKQIKKTTAVDFTATGQKQVGEKATGTVKVSKLTQTDYSVPAGTQITDKDSGLIFTTTTAVVIPASQPCFPTYCAQSVNVGVIAAAAGVKYNGATGAAQADNVTATFVGSTAGGTDKTITVVSADDITKATAQLQSQDANAVRDELAKQFANDEIVIAEAYVVEPSTPVSAPAVDQEASNAKLTAETSYTLLGVKRADLKAVYDAFLATQIGGDASQKVYQSGDESTQFSTFQKVDGGYTVHAIATAQVGPNIDPKVAASNARGKMTGEVQQSIGSIQGVEKVDVSLSPFWVNRVPQDTGRIKITFTLKND